MSITNRIKLIHLVGSIDPDSNKFREYHFSGLDQVIHLLVSADLEPDPLTKSFVNMGPDDYMYMFMHPIKWTVLMKGQWTNVKNRPACGSNYN